MYKIECLVIAFLIRVMIIVLRFFCTYFYKSIVLLM